MNEWARRSIKIANSPGYLDKLHEVYPVTIEAKRKLPSSVRRALKNAYEKQDNLKLMEILLKLEKFPIKDPYVAFLRKRDIFLEYNPMTVKRIAERIFSMGFEGMIDGIEEPKEFNRQIGTLFHKWLSKFDYPNLPTLEFEKFKGIAFLSGSGRELKDYANRVLHCSLGKEPDLLAKAGMNYIIGEAKFLTDYGGHQNAQFEDALRLLKGEEGNAIRIALLDGVVWIKDSTKMFRTVCGLQKDAFTALLLKDFLEKLNKKE